MGQTGQRSADPAKKPERDEFNVAVRKRLGTSTGKQKERDEHLQDVDYGDLFDDKDLPNVPFKLEATVPEANEWTANTYDKLLSAEVMLPRNGEQYMGTADQQRMVTGTPLANAHGIHSWIHANTKSNFRTAVWKHIQQT
jgi:hypothetical protein